jgi:hypothetical protein
MEIRCANGPSGTLLAAAVATAQPIVARLVEGDDPGVRRRSGTQPHLHAGHTGRPRQAGAGAGSPRRGRRDDEIRADRPGERGELRLRIDGEPDDHRGADPTVGLEPGGEPAQLVTGGRDHRELAGHPAADLEPRRSRQQPAEHDAGRVLAAGQLGGQLGELGCALAGQRDEHGVCLGVARLGPVGGVDLPLDHPVRVGDPHERAGHCRRDERHDHHEGEHRLVEQPELNPDLEDHDLGQPTGVHQQADRRGLPPGHPLGAGGDHGGEELAGDRGGHDQAELPEAGDTDRRDVDLQARDDEEDRQQQQQAHLLQAFEDLPREPGSPAARHDRAEHERPEDGVHADLLGDEGAEQQPDQHRGEHVRGEPARAVVPPRHAGEQRPQHEERQHREHRRETEDPGHPRDVAARGHGDHHREQHPPHDVVDHGAGQREHAHLSPMHAALGEDAREHGQRRDRHGDPEEEHEPEHRNRPVPHGVVERVQHDRDPCAERERYDHRAHGHRARRALPPADQRHVDLEADDEHEEHEPELGDHREGAAHLHREQQHVEIARQQPEEGGPQRDPGSDLAEHSRLAEPAEQPAREPRSRDDDGDVEQHERNDDLRIHDGAPSG